MMTTIHRIDKIRMHDVQEYPSHDPEHSHFYVLRFNCIDEDGNDHVVEFFSHNPNIHIEKI